MDKILIILSIIIIIFIILSIIISFLILIIGFKRSKKLEMVPIGNKLFKKYVPEMAEEKAWFLSQDYQEFTISSSDGIKLVAKYLAHKNPKGTLLLMHGHRGSGLRDFSCIIKFYYSLGYNLLLPDQRAHGKSGGNYITFGIKERFDCYQWIKYINSNLDNNLPIFLDGVSLGATTVLMTLGFDLPSNVKGVIADSGFTSPFEIIRHVLNKIAMLPSFPILYITKGLVKVFANIKMDEYSTINALNINKIPLLLVHGTNDHLVPPWMSAENFDACPVDKELYMIDNAGHGMSYLVDRGKCQRALINFLDKYGK